MNEICLNQWGFSSSGLLDCSLVLRIVLWGVLLSFETMQIWFTHDVLVTLYRWSACLNLSYIWSRHLNHLSVFQLMNGLRKFDVGYHGDPDMQPIRSFESKFMVRMLHSLSSYINDKVRGNFCIVIKLRSVRKTTFQEWVCLWCLISERTFGAQSLNSKITSSDTRPHMKWAVSMHRFPGTLPYYSNMFILRKCTTIPYDITDIPYDKVAFFTQIIPPPGLLNYY